MSIRVNSMMTNIRKVLAALGMIRTKKEARIVNDLVKKLSVKTSTIELPVKNLSGGNQQKVVIAKWLNLALKVVIFDEPTRGVDVGAKYEIYKIINSLVEQGVAVIIISSELPEIIGMCDRVVVMSKGHITGEIDKNKERLTEKKLMMLAVAEV